jgi:hypothetical protein
MALRILPFRQYSEHDVINMFANDTVDNKPSTNGNGSAGVFVKVNAGNLDLDPITYNTNAYLGNTSYPFLGAAKYPSVPLTFTAATNDAPVFGLTLNQSCLYDENDEKLLYNPQKTAELQACLSGQACPVLTRGMVTLADSAIDWVDANMAPNSVLFISATAGKVSGLVSSSSAQITGYNVIGKVLATGQRVSSLGQSDYFASTTTGKFALVHFDCTRPQLA